MQFVKLHLWKWSPIGLEFQTWTTLRLVSCCQPSRASQRVDVSQMQPSIHAFFSDFGAFQKPHQSPNVGPDVVSYHIYHYVTRPTSVDKCTSCSELSPAGRFTWMGIWRIVWLYEFIFRSCAGYRNTPNKDAAIRCLAIKKTWKRSRIAVFCWATGISARRVFVKVQMEVESFRSRVTSIIAFCRLQSTQNMSLHCEPVIWKSSTLTSRDTTQS